MKAKKIIKQFYFIISLTIFVLFINISKCYCNQINDNFEHVLRKKNLIKNPNPNLIHLNKLNEVDEVKETNYRINNQFDGINGDKTLNGIKNDMQIFINQSNNVYIMAKYGQTVSLPCVIHRQQQQDLANVSWNFVYLNHHFYFVFII
jgi:hypothetical protein